MVIRSWRIAAVVELTRDGIGAMATGSDLGSRWHGDGAQLSQKLGCQLVLQFCNLPIEVSHSEELLGIDRAALKNITPIHMHQIHRA